MISKSPKSMCAGIADDDPKMIRLLRRCLEQAGFRVVSASDGPAAIELVENNDLDLLVLDVVMPGMDGCDALTTIRQTPGLELLPIIAVTASSVLEQETDLREKFNGYLRKPFTQRQLFTELAHFLPRQPKPENNSENPAVAVQEIGNVQRLHLLAAGHGHDEINFQEFKQGKPRDAEVEEFFH